MDSSCCIMPASRRGVLGCRGINRGRIVGASSRLVRSSAPVCCRGAFLRDTASTLRSASRSRHSSMVGSRIAAEQPLCCQLKGIPGR